MAAPFAISESAEEGTVNLDRIAKSQTMGLSGWKEIGFSQITQKWLVWELSCKNIIFHPLGKLFKSRKRGLWPQNWQIYEPFYFKFEMGLAGAFFEPQPCNFGKLDIFSRCSNDITTIFWNSLWGQTCQKCQKPMCPDNTEVHASFHQHIFIIKNHNFKITNLLR